MSKRRIAIIISSFNPIIGGSEKQLELIGKKLSKEGYEVDVITRKYKGLTKREKIGDLNINRIPVLYINKYLEKISFVMNTLLYLLSKKKYDFIIASQLGSCSYISKIYKKARKVPYVSRITGGEAKILSNSQQGRKKFKKTCDNDNYFIAINNEIRDALIDLGVKRNNIKFITNGVEIKDRVNIINNKSVLYCGRIEKIKGVDILLNSWELIEKEIENIKLVIVGDGSEKAKLMEQYSHLKNVEWVGKVKNTDNYYNKARVLISPSRNEGISNTILEAMANGIPVIATNVGGTPEIIKNNINGILVNKEDSKELSIAIKSFLTNDDLLCKLSKSAYDYVKNEYSIDKATLKYKELIYELGDYNE